MDDMMVILGSDMNEVNDTNAPYSPEHTLKTAKEQEDALKKIGNVKRYELDRKSLDNLFDVGRTNLENVVKERQKELKKEQRKFSLIYDTVAFFQNGKAKSML